MRVSASSADGLVIGTLDGVLGYNDAGSYAIVWTLNDGVNPPVTSQTTLTIRDVPPPPGAPPISVFPQDLLQDVRSNITIKGHGFGSSTWVELNGPKGVVPADTVVILSPTSLLASVMVPASMAGQYDVVVTNPDGEQRLPGGAIVSTYKIVAFDPKTGDPIPSPGTGPVLSPASPSAFQCEGVNFCSVVAPVGVAPPQRCISAGINPYFGPLARLLCRPRHI